jgi:hypothetical protein
VEWRKRKREKGGREKEIERERWKIGRESWRERVRILV